MKTGKIVLAGCFTAVVLAAVAVPQTAEEKAKAEQVKKEIKTLTDERIGTGYGIWNTYFLRKFGANDTEPWTDAELAAEEKKMFAREERLLQLAPDNGSFHLYYAEMLSAFERYAESLEHARKAAELIKGGYSHAEALFRVAEAQYALNDLAGCRATLEQMDKENVATAIRHREDWTGRARQCLRFMKGNDFDNLRYPHGTRAKPFPKPQEAKYTESFADLKGKTVSISLSGVKEDDARVKLLRTKLSRMGAKTEISGLMGSLLGGLSADYRIGIELADDAPVEKKEGYALEIGADKATIAARDPQGVLWGVVSFVQCVNPETCAVRQCSVKDWPDAPERGYLGVFNADTVEDTIFQKMNSVNHQRNSPGEGNARSPLLVYLCNALADEMNSLGLTIFYDGHELGEGPDLPYSVPRTYDFRLKVAKLHAAMGAGLYWGMDDVRFPLNKHDKAKYGTAANCDAKEINRVYQAVKKEYPNFKTIFCPPFYWGPDSKAPYPEDREAYLKSIGDYLDPSVDVYWTGAQVKGYEKRPYQVKWFMDLVKRGPSIFQNGIGPHNLLDYGVDDVEWGKLHYDGFHDVVRHFHNNSLGFHEIGPLSTLGDWLWNAKGYDAPSSCKAGVTQKFGDGVYDALKEGLADVAYFDKWRYGSLNANIVYEDPADLEKKYQHAKECYERACKLNPAVRGLGSYARGLGWAANVVKGAKNPPDFLSKFKKDIADTRALAIAETKADPGKGDLVYTPMDLRGNLPSSGKFGAKKTPRFVKWMRGANTSQSTLSFQFECDPFPATGDYKLVICGMQDELKDETKIAIAVNGVKVFEGPCGFPVSAGAKDSAAPDFELREFRIPFDSMKRHNTVSVSCATEGFNPNAAPYVGVNYMVLRKSR